MTDRAAELARLYDLDLDADPGDVELYLALAARTGGPVLELAVGTGRVAVPLAGAGYEVVGVDLDAAMLHRARARAASAGPEAAARLRLVEADLRHLRLPDAGRYRLAFIALNSLSLLSRRSDQAAALETLAAHLAPGGLAVVDAWLPDGEALARYDGRLALEWARHDPASGAWVTKATSARHAPASRTVELTTIYEEGLTGEPATRHVRVDRLRLADPDELVALAEAAGLVTETVAGGYDLEPIGPDAERILLVAVRA